MKREGFLDCCTTPTDGKRSEILATLHNHLYGEWSLVVKVGIHLAIETDASPVRDLTDEFAVLSCLIACQDHHSEQESAARGDRANPCWNIAPLSPHAVRIGGQPRAVAAFQLTRLAAEVPSRSLALPVEAKEQLD